MKTQNQVILAGLKAGYVIDPNFALREYGCSRLAARIHELRNQGHEIFRAKIPFKSRITGRKGNVAAYWMRTEHGSA